MERPGTIEAARYAVDAVVVMVGTAPGSRRALLEYLVAAGVVGHTAPPLAEGTTEERVRDALGRLVDVLDHELFCSFRELKAQSICRELLVLLPE